MPSHNSSWGAIGDAVDTSSSDTWSSDTFIIVRSFPAMLYSCMIYIPSSGADPINDQTTRQHAAKPFESAIASHFHYLLVITDVLST